MPTIIHWPGITTPGTASHVPVITVDFFPTIPGAAGLKVPQDLHAKSDGQSLVPLLRDPDTATLNRAAVFWHYPHYHMMGTIPHSAVRAGEWKLIERHAAGPLELYNLADDIHEDHNLINLQPERTAELRQSPARLARICCSTNAHSQPGLRSPNPHWSQKRSWLESTITGTEIRQKSSDRAFSPSF